MNKRAWILLGILVALVPLGLISQSSAWGEWDNSYYQKLLGFIPKGIAHANGVEGLLPDYSLPSIGSVGGYYLSALVGIGLLLGIYFILHKWVKRG
jgi:hypothetical protein